MDDAVAAPGGGQPRLPDTIDDNSYHAQIAASNVYAQEAYNGLLAQYRFLGLLAGIKGPNDTDDDVTAARDAVIAALKDFLSAGPLSEQVRKGWEDLQRNRETLQQQMWDRREFEAEQVLLDILPRGHIHDQSETFLEGLASGARISDLRNNLLNYGASAETIAAVEAYAEKARELARLEDFRRGERRAAIWAFFEGIWTSLRSYYDDKMQLIREGKWLLAASKVAIDASVIAAEEILYAAIIAAITTATGGAALAGGVAIRAAVRMAVSVTRQGSRVTARGMASTLFTVEVRKVVHNAHGMPELDPSAGRILDHDIDVSKDLTLDERRAMGEGGQGSTRPDADAPENGDTGANEHEQRRGDEDQDAGSNSRPPKEVECFNVPNGVDRNEFDRQLAEQQSTINNLTADDLGYAHAVLDQARQTWRARGGKGSFTTLIRGDGKAQEVARKNYEAALVASGLPKAEIDEIMSRLDATHYLDIIAGGNPKLVGMGGSAENQRIGPAWTHTNTPSGVSRADQLRNEAEAMRAAGLHDQNMKIKLSSC